MAERVRHIEESSEEYTTEGNEEDFTDTPSEEGESAELDPDERYKLRLIKEVRKRQPLWNSWTRNYSCRPLKDKMWLKVVSRLHEKIWSELSDKEKQYKVKKAQMTWKNMKDCFSRYLNKVQKGEKRKRYRYFKQLKFLQHIVKNSKRPSFRAPKRESYEDNAKKSTPGTSDDFRGSKKSSKRPRNEIASNQVSPGTTSSTRDATGSSRQRSNDVASYQKSVGTSPLRQPNNDLASCQKSVSTSTRVDALSNHTCNDPECGKVMTLGTSLVGKVETPGGSGFATSMLLPESRGQPMKFSDSAQLELLLRAKHEKEPDEDKDFASSLVPMLKELDYDKKHYAKTNILNVMKVARYLVLDGSVDLPGPVEAASRTSHITESLASSPSTSASHDYDPDPCSPGETGEHDSPRPPPEANLPALSQ